MSFDVICRHVHEPAATWWSAVTCRLIVTCGQRRLPTATTAAAAVTAAAPLAALAAAAAAATPTLTEAAVQRAATLVLRTFSGAQQQRVAPLHRRLVLAGRPKEDRGSSSAAAVVAVVVEEVAAGIGAARLDSSGRTMMMKWTQKMRQNATKLTVVLLGQSTELGGCHSMVAVVVVVVRDCTCVGTTGVLMLQELPALVGCGIGGAVLIVQMFLFIGLCLNE